LALRNISILRKFSYALVLSIFSITNCSAQSTEYDRWSLKQWSKLEMPVLLTMKNGTQLEGQLLGMNEYWFVFYHKTRGLPDPSAVGDWTSILNRDSVHSIRHWLVGPDDIPWHYYSAGGDSVLIEFVDDIFLSKHEKWRIYRRHISGIPMMKLGKSADLASVQSEAYEKLSISYFQSLDYLSVSDPIDRGKPNSIYVEWGRSSLFRRDDNKSVLIDDDKRTSSHIHLLYIRKLTNSISGYVALRTIPKSYLNLSRADFDVFRKIHLLASASPEIGAIWTLGPRINYKNKWQVDLGAGIGGYSQAVKYRSELNLAAPNEYPSLHYVTSYTSSVSGITGNALIRGKYFVKPNACLTFGYHYQYMTTVLLPTLERTFYDGKENPSGGSIGTFNRQFGHDDLEISLARN